MDVIDDDFGLDSLLPGVHPPELLRAGARVVRAPAGTAIFAEGDGDARLYLVGHGRVAKHLLWLAQRFGVQEDGALRVPMDFTQRQFAYLVGASRESVNKTLGDFADQGWIVVGNDSIMIRQSEPLATRTHGTRRQHPSPAGGRR